MAPQSFFKRKSSGNFFRNLQSSAEVTRNDDRGTGSRFDDTTARSLAVRCADVRGGADKMVIPNRVFVGGICRDTTESNIEAVFEPYGNIKAIKILRDENGISKGYGFVTFQTAKQAKSIIKERGIIIKGRKVTIAPAFEKKRLDQPVSPLPSTDMKLSSAVEKSSGSYICEQARWNKGFEEQTCKFNYTFTAEYSGYEVVAAQLPMENTRTYMDSGMFFSEPNMQFHDYGNTQINYLPYPTWVYIPEQTYPGNTFGYSMNGNILEMVQAVPAPLYLPSGELN